MSGFGCEFFHSLQQAFSQTLPAIGRFHVEPFYLAASRRIRERMKNDTSDRLLPYQRKPDTPISSRQVIPELAFGIPDPNINRFKIFFHQFERGGEIFLSRPANITGGIGKGSSEKTWFAGHNNFPRRPKTRRSSIIRPISSYTVADIL